MATVSLPSDATTAASLSHRSFDRPVRNASTLVLILAPFATRESSKDVSKTSTLRERLLRHRICDGLVSFTGEECISPRRPGPHDPLNQPPSPQHQYHLEKLLYFLRAYSSHRARLFTLFWPRAALGGRNSKCQFLRLHMFRTTPPRCIIPALRNRGSAQ